VELSIEEVEEIVAPGITLNDNETFVIVREVPLHIEELEEIVAPGTTFNHNETSADCEIELNLESLEDIVVPGASFNHNEASADGAEVEFAIEQLEDIAARVSAPIITKVWLSVATSSSNWRWKSWKKLRRQAECGTTTKP
jgi:hypothetical protein